MAKYVSFYDWVGDATEEEFQVMLAKAKQKRLIYFFLALIPFVNWVTGGLYIFSDNTVRFMKTRGRQQGEASFTGKVIMVWSFILPAIIVVLLCSKINSLGHLVLGWKSNQQ